MSRIIKHSHDTFGDWEDFVPTLFTFYLQSFEVGFVVECLHYLVCYAYSD